MTLSSGQYNDHCEELRKVTNGSAAIVVVLEGNRGSGVSVCGDQESVEQLPHLLEQLAYQLRRGMSADRRTLLTFGPGDIVQKFTGDYKAIGEVRGVFTTRAGKLRYAVEIDAGMLMIYSHKNLRPPMETMSAEELARMSSGHCPDCNHRGFVLGPRGGSAMNISCGGCDNGFNVTTFGGRVVMGHRLPKDDRQ